jgi:hypothetical protein
MISQCIELLKKDSKPINDLYKIHVYPYVLYGSSLIIFNTTMLIYIVYLLKKNNK